MQTIQGGGPPPPPNLRGYGGRGRKRGFWANFKEAGFGIKLQIVGSLLGLLLILGYFIYLFLPDSEDTAQAQEPPPAAAPAVVEQLPTLTPTTLPLDESQQPYSAQTVIAPVSPVATPLEQSQLAGQPQPAAGQPQSTQNLPAGESDPAATATYQAAISRPAYISNPQAAPYLVGVITYEPGCTVSNIGFTTSGLNGEPYYLYLRAPLDRDPFMQIVQITGFIQQFEECQHPVVFVDQLFWMDQQGTPAPWLQLP